MNDVYEPVATEAQTVSQTVGSGGKAFFDVKIENDGVVPTSFVVRAHESDEWGWAVRYWSGWRNITQQVMSSEGYTTKVLDPGEGGSDGVARMRRHEECLRYGSSRFCGSDKPRQCGGRGYG